MNNLKVEVPSDFTAELPPHARKWHLQYGISPELMSSHGIGYSPTYDRVVIPIYNRITGELEAMQMRAVRPDQKPKYLNPAGPKVSRALFCGNRIWHEYDYKAALPSVVIVEDVLSAIKVGRVWPCVSILGTNMTDERAGRIAADYFGSAIIWMDSDKAGRSGRVAATRQLAMQGFTTYYVESPLDPKNYNNDEIRQYIESRKEC